MTANTAKDLDVEKWFALVNNKEPKLKDLKALYASNRGYLNCKNESSQFTALHAPSCRYHPEIIEWLISEGADINARSKWIGATPLDRAAISGRLDIIKILLANGAYLNARDHYSQETALHFASYCGHSKIVEYMLTQGAYMKIQNKYGYTPGQMVDNDETRKVFDSFRPDLVQICIETLYQAHTDQQQSFALSQQELDSLARHLSTRLAPYITI